MKQVSIFQKKFDKLACFSKLLRQKFVSETSFAVFQIVLLTQIMRYIWTLAVLAQLHIIIFNL